jgi:Flp pilus assembly pilin Flp
LEHRSDAGAQFLNVQWFGQEIIGSSLQTRLNAMPVRLTGDDDDGDLLSIGNRLNGHAECQSVDVGHTYVQQDEVGLDLEGLLDAVLAVDGGKNLHAFGHENALKNFAHARIVIDHQDLLLAHTMPSPGRRFLQHKMGRLVECAANDLTYAADLQWIDHTEKPCFSCLLWQHRGGWGLTNRVRRSNIKRHLRKLLRVVRRQSGQSLVEYSLILALIAVVAILVLQGLGGKVNNTLSSVNANLP